MFKAIAAVDSEFGIGKNGEIPWGYSNDLAFFRFMTSGSQVVFGRKTFDNIGVPLPKREVYVFSREHEANVINEDPFVKYTNEEEFFLIDESQYKDTYICGGETIYRMFLDDIREIVLTRVPDSFNCDTYFPEFRDRFQKFVEFDLDGDLKVEKWCRSENAG